MLLAPARPRPKTRRLEFSCALSTQRERDEESSLMHYRARSYDPRLGRFVQRDPLDTKASTLSGYIPTAYNYATHLPTSRRDSTGLFSKAVHDEIHDTVLGPKFAKRSWVAQQMYDAIRRANTDNPWSLKGQDRLDRHLHPEFHYDNNKIIEANQYVEQQYEAIRGQGPNRASSYREVAEAFGRILHARQDFYSHSTFVENWLLRDVPQFTVYNFDIYFGTNTFKNAIAANKDTPNKIPTFSFAQTTQLIPFEGKEVTGFLAFEREVVTGYFDVGRGRSPTHARINKDHEGTTRGGIRNALGQSLHSFAKAAASLQTSLEWGRFLKETAKPSSVGFPDIATDP